MYTLNSFKLVEKREATLTQPTLWIFEVQLRGMFHRLVDGEILGENLIKNKNNSFESI